MRKARWLAAWRNSESRPVFYHCISRVVDRRLVFGPVEKEKFRALMRMQEKFTGCRVTAYCVMGNHFHLLLEVPPMAAERLSDTALLKRLAALYSEAVVAEIGKELAEARQHGGPGAVAAVHGRFTYRMHDLGQFMKGLLQRFTQWFNSTHARSGRLWEDRFKSVIVEDGVAARTMAAYIDLNPVRAGIVQDPAGYRWSSYGEAVGGGPRGNGATARAGLVRAWGAHQGLAAEAALWAGEISRNYRKLLMGGAVGKTEERVNRAGEIEVRTLRKGMNKAAAARESARQALLGELPFAAMLRHRIRYFSDGAVIGSRGFVDEAFAMARSRFGPKRTSGARKLKREAAPASGWLWSLRDLQKP